MTIDGVKVTANFCMTPVEARNYVEYVAERVSDVTNIFVTLNEDETVDINWTARHQKFERIRRITGYLTGVLDSWNDAKQAEEKDRVKHVG